MPGLSIIQNHTCIWRRKAPVYFQKLALTGPIRICLHHVHVTTMYMYMTVMYVQVYLLDRHT